MAHQIALDGPAGAGKSSVARAVASTLGYLFVDSGAMYRSIAAMALRAGLDGDDTTAWEEIAQTQVIELKNNSSVVVIGGLDVTEEIRTPEVTSATRYAANNPVIREVLVHRQREIGAAQSIVMEGRDIGTVVLPDAACKMYLDASPEVRARRRYEEMISKSMAADLSEILQAVIERDESDKNRAVGPLKQADDAYYLDTSDMSFDEVVAAVVTRAQEHR